MVDGDNKKIIINEVGLRDGLQNHPSLISSSAKIRLGEALIDAGLSALEVTSFVHPKAVPQLADAEVVMSHFGERGARGVESEQLFSVLIANERGLDRALSVGAKHVALVLATTDQFNLKNINVDTASATEEYLRLIRKAQDHGVSVRVYLSCVCECPYTGKVPPQRVHQLANLFLDAGIPEISIADTTGSGNPQQIINILSPLVSRYGADRFNVHLHDTRGLGLANAWAAFSLGIRKFDSAIGGLGGCPFAPGASGNLATEDLVFMFEDAGYQTGVDFQKLLSAISIAEEITQMNLGGKILPWYRSQSIKEDELQGVKDNRTVNDNRAIA